MIKYIYTIKKKECLSLQEFRQHWDSDIFIDSLIGVVETLGGTDLRRSLVLDVEFNKTLNEVRGEEDALYDAVIEYILPSAASLLETLETDEFKERFAELEALEEKFIDLKHSPRCFVEYFEPLID